MKEEPDGVKHEPPGDKDPPASVQLKSEKTSAVEQEKKRGTEGGDSDPDRVNVKTEPTEDVDFPGRVKGSDHGPQSETVQHTPKKSKQKTNKKTNNRSTPGTEKSSEKSSDVVLDSGDHTSEKTAVCSKAESSATPEVDQTETELTSVSGDTEAENLNSKDAKSDTSTKVNLSVNVIDTVKGKESSAEEKTEQCIPESKESMKQDESGPSVSVHGSVGDHQSDGSQRQTDCAQDNKQTERNKLSPAERSVTECHKTVEESSSDDTVVSNSKLSTPVSSGSSEIEPSNSLKDKDCIVKDKDVQLLDKSDPCSSSGKVSSAAEGSEVGDLAPELSEDVAAKKQSTQSEASGEDPVTTGEACAETEEVKTSDKVDAQKLGEKPEGEESKESCAGEEPSCSVPEEKPSQELSESTEQAKPAVDEDEEAKAKTDMPAAECQAETDAKSTAGEDVKSPKLVDSGKKPESESLDETDKKSDLVKSSTSQEDPVNRLVDGEKSAEIKECNEKSSTEAKKCHDKEKLLETDIQASSEISASTCEGRDIKSMETDCENKASSGVGSKTSVKGEGEHKEGGDNQKNVKEKDKQEEDQARREGASQEQKEALELSPSPSKEKEGAGSPSVADSEKSTKSQEDESACVCVKSTQDVSEDNRVAEKDLEKGVKSVPVSSKEPLEDFTTGDSLAGNSKSKTEKTSAVHKDQTQDDAQPEHSVTSKNTFVEDSELKEKPEDACEKKLKGSDESGEKASERKPELLESASSTNSPSSKVQVPAESPEADDVSKADLTTDMDTTAAPQVDDDAKDDKAEKMEVAVDSHKDSDVTEKEKETPKSRPSRTRRGRKVDEAEETKEVSKDKNLDESSQKEDKATAKKSTPLKTAETLVNGHTEGMEEEDKGTEEQDNAKDTKTPRTAPRRGRGGSRRRGRGGRRRSRVTKRAAPQIDSEETNSEPAEKRARSGGIKRGGLATRGRRNGKSATQGREVENSSDSDAPLVNSKGRGKKTTGRGGAAKKAGSKQTEIKNGEERNDSSSSDDLPLSKAAKVSEIWSMR